MPKPTEPPPLKHHRGADQAYVRVAGRQIYLGKWGSPKAERAYRELVASWATTGGLPAPADEITIIEVVARYMTHVEGYYRDADGEQTTEVDAIRTALNPVRDLYGDVPAVEFGPNALRLVREEFVKSGLVRSGVNKRTTRVRAMFKWAVGRELLPARVHEALRCVEPLKRGRTEAPESKPVRPPKAKHVDAALAHMSRQVRAMVELQRLSGMRPGEVVLMRPGDISRGGDVWVYKPMRHKGSWRGHDRKIYLGPKAQRLLAQWLLGRAADAFLFSPREAEEERLQRLHEQRKTPAGQGNEPNPNRNLSHIRVRYDVPTYRRAITRACAKAKVPKWSPLQLRHEAATTVRAQFGLEAAQVTLGHAKADVTQVYAERDAELARRIAAEVG